jgi:septal ring factor EnvC (AmiA/AmiB activator)
MNDFSKRRWKWMLIGWALLRLIFNFETGDLLAAQTDLIEKDLTQKKKELKKIRKELYQKKVKEKEIRRKESSVLKRLHQVTTEFHKKEKELKRMKAKASRIKRRLEQTRSKIIMLNQEIEQTREKLISRLNALYKMKRIPSETFLFPSGSYSDLLKIDKYLRVIIDSDAHFIDTYRYQVVLKSRYQEELIQDQLQWDRNITEVEMKKKEIEKVRTRKRAFLKSIQNQKLVYQRVIGEMEERAKELQTLIGRLEKEKNLLAYGKARHDSLKGKLKPPVQGKVISLFKEWGQNGIEISAPMGTEIRAVLPGRVLYADWFKRFGNVVIIDHGGHIFTVSAYCSRLLKKVGDIVSQGEPIARVGGKDSSKEPVLYFEIRFRGKPQDPVEWISRLRKQ